VDDYSVTSENTDSLLMLLPVVVNSDKLPLLTVAFSDWTCLISVFR